MTNERKKNHMTFNIAVKWEEIFLLKRVQFYENIKAWPWKEKKKKEEKKQEWTISCKF